MEKIIISEIERKVSAKDVDFWSITDANGEKYTVWNKDIAETLISMKGNACVVEINISPDGKFKNIRGVKPLEGSEAVQGAPVSKLNHSRDKTIVAQCLTKIVWRNEKDATSEDVLDTYNYFLKEL